METATIILGILLITSGYVIYNLLKKVEIYEDTAVQQAEYIISISTVISEMDSKLSNPHLVQAFSSDDEIGWFFQDLQQIQKILNEYNRLNMYGQEKEGEKE